MPTVLEWSPATDPDALAGQVRDSVAGGRVAILPSRAGYVAVLNPEDPDAGRKLDALRSLGGAPPVVLAYGPEDVANLGFTVPRPAARLMQRVWPGPVTIALPVSAGFRPPPQWNEAVRNSLTADGLVRFRSPDHAVFDALLPGLRAVVVDTNRMSPTAVADALGDAAGVVVSAGDIQALIRPTVVRFDADRWAIVEEGIVGEEDLAKLTARIVLFVCTGNTCRSPMSEALARRLLADRLGCTVDELPARGYWIMSAGVAAYGGEAASAGAVDAVAEWGADLSRHESRPVNPQILAAADDVIAMTHSHAAALSLRYPGFGPTVRLLCGDDDLVDPIGGDAAVYRECARTIHANLERLVTEWVAS